MRINEKPHKKVSPPFEGGVVGTIDYHIYTCFNSRPGWLIHLFHNGNPHGEHHKIEKEKKIKSLKALDNNQPPRPV